MEDNLAKVALKLDNAVNEQLIPDSCALSPFAATNWKSKILASRGQQIWNFISDS